MLHPVDNAMIVLRCVLHLCCFHGVRQCISGAMSALSTSAGGCVTRARQGGVPSNNEVGRLINSGSSNANFFATLNLYHGSVHCAIGGTMCSPRSAEAPEFWLHHSNVDRIWALWQRRSNAHLTAFQTTASFPGSMSRGVRPNAVTNLDNHLGISVTYSGFQTSMPSLGEAPDNGTEEEQWANNARLWETMLRVTQQQSSQGLGPN
eukprot:m.230915 g.230915  ORF g.230915 m.230915 type:complete len:206 (+) comp18862_c1_seq4:486-1103(+)